MQDHPRTPRARTKSAVALLLTFTAGWVDVVGYLTVYHLFTANMTGNTVHLGDAVAIGNWREAVRAGATLTGFVGGSVLGRLVIEWAARKGLRKVASLTLIGEALLIALCVWTTLLLLDSPHAESSSGAVCGSLALLSAAMGLQTATLTRIGPLTIHTTFVTGMLNNFAQAASQWLFWAHDQRRGGADLRTLLRSGRTSGLGVAEFMAAIWICYMAGAVVGTRLAQRCHTRALGAAVLLLLFAVICDQFQPLSLEEEQEQA